MTSLRASSAALLASTLVCSCLGPSSQRRSARARAADVPIAAAPIATAEPRREGPQRDGGRSSQRDEPRGAMPPSEPQEDRSSEPVRWRRRKLTVVIDDSVARLGPHAVEAVEDAFTTWQKTGAALPEIVFEHGSGGKIGVPDGKNTVLVAPIELPGQEDDLAVTLTYSDATRAEIVEGDIVLNARYTFRVLKPEGAHARRRLESRALLESDVSACVVPSEEVLQSSSLYDLANVMTHEAGHFLGLGEQLHDPSATMFACTGRLETHKRVLGTRDRLEISALYPAGSTPPEEPSQPAELCVPPRIDTSVAARTAAASAASCQ